jgi:restriction system protein
MTRRSVWVQMQREAEHRRRDAERAARALERERQRQLKEAARQRAYGEKEQKRLHAEQRAREVEQLTQEITERVGQLDGLLTASLSTDTSFEIQALKEQPAKIPFDPGELAIPIEPPVKQLPPPPSGLQKLLPGAKAKHAQAVIEAEGRVS